MNSAVHGKTISTFCQALYELSKSVQQLSVHSPSSNSSDCIKFKQEQLLSIVHGNYSPMEELVPLDSKILRSGAFDSLAHMGLIPAQKIECDYSEAFEGGYYSVLDLHLEEKSWCRGCVNESSKRIDLTTGSVNKFHCWRRGHSSGMLGFLIQASLRYIRGKIQIQLDETVVSRALAAQEFESGKLGYIKHSSTQLGQGTTMVCTIHIDADQDQGTDELFEIEGLLGQQMLHSKRVNLRSPEVENVDKARNDKVPGFLSEMIRSCHQKWHLDGPSRQNLGLLAVAVVNNKNDFCKSSALQNTLRNTCNEMNVDFQTYSLDEISAFSKGHLQFNTNTIPENTYSLALIFDSLIDLGGILNE